MSEPMNERSERRKRAKHNKHDEAERPNEASKGLVIILFLSLSLSHTQSPSQSPWRATILHFCICSLEWNPMEPMNFTVGNEDHNCYSFDMRKLSEPTMIHKGHVGAVLSIGWSSTGREFVTGSYDRTVRIFNYRSGISRDCYYGRRMQRVFCVNYTADAKYVISGSDDTNLRGWEARASEKIGQKVAREEQATYYKEALIRKYGHMPEVKRIVNQRNLPKFIKKQTGVKQLQKESAKRKQTNVMNHSKKGSVEWEGERKKAIVREVD